jgi:hypothetical protein
MTDDEREKIRADALKEANLESRLKSVEDALSNIEGAVKWFFRALWGGIAYLLTQVASVLFNGGWPK